MIWVLIAAAILAIVYALGEERTVTAEQERNSSNARVAGVYRAAGLVWYPHELQDGRVRWYRVDGTDDTVEL